MGLTKEMVVGGRGEEELVVYVAFLTQKMVFGSPSNASVRWWEKTRAVHGHLL